MDLFVFLEAIGAEEEITVRNRKLVNNYKLPPYSVSVKNARIIRDGMEVSILASGICIDDAFENLAISLSSARIYFQGKYYVAPQLTCYKPYF